MAKKREQFLKALESEGDNEEFVGFVDRHNSREDFDLAEFIQTFPRKDHQRMWTSLVTKVEHVVLSRAYLPESRANQDAIGGDDEDAEADNGPVLKFLRSVAQFAHIFLEDPKRQAPEALRKVSEILHNILFRLHMCGDEGSALQVVIARLCEQQWTMERPGAELLVTNLMPYLIVKSLEEGSLQADVKRVYAVRTALLLLDFDDESAESLKTLLLSCVCSPLYLQCAEGGRFLSYLFGLHPAFVGDLHDTIKNVIPVGKRGVLRAYGAVYFRAWKEATGQYLMRIEQECVQDLISCAVHAASPQMATSIRHVLSEFLVNKSYTGVDEMLLRLYEPILWRALHVANPVVRAQAAQQLVDAFPLQDPDQSKVELDAVLQKQFDALAALLTDNSPRVRCVAVKGTCEVLGKFWDVIPAATQSALLSTLVADLSHDAASAAVRAAVFAGIEGLLANHLSHSTLKPLLPALRPLIHDRSERVRLSFVSLLAAVKRIRTITFTSVVPLDDLLLRLRADGAGGSGSGFGEAQHARAPKSPKTAAALAHLLLNSYLPDGASGAEMVSRCVAFLRSHEHAAVVFYRNVHTAADLDTQMKMVKLVYRAVVSCVRKEAKREEQAEQQKKKKGGRKKKGGKRSFEDVDEDADEVPDQTSAGGGNSLSGSDLPLMTALLRVVAALSDGLLGAKQCREGRRGAAKVRAAVLAQLRAEFETEGMALLMGRLGTGSEDAKCALLRLASHVPRDAPQSEGIAAGVVEDLLALGKQGTDADAEEEEGEGAAGGGMVSEVAFGPLVDVLCAWGEEEKVVGMVIDSLAAVPNAASATATGAGAGAGAGSKKQKRKRAGAKKSSSTKSAAAFTGVLDPVLALRVLERVLAKPDARDKILGSGSSSSSSGQGEQLMAAFEGLRQVTEGALGSEAAAAEAHEAYATATATANGNGNGAGMELGHVLVVALNTYCKVLLVGATAEAEVKEAKEATAKAKPSAPEAEDEMSVSADGEVVSTVMTERLVGVLDWASSNALPALWSATPANGSSSSVSSSPAPPAAKSRRRTGGAKKASKKQAAAKAAAASDADAGVSVVLARNVMLVVVATASDMLPLLSIKCESDDNDEADGDSKESVGGQLLAASLQWCTALFGPGAGAATHTLLSPYLCRLLFQWSVADPAKHGGFRVLLGAVMAAAASRAAAAVKATLASGENGGDAASAGGMPQFGALQRCLAACLSDSDRARGSDSVSSTATTAAAAAADRRAGVAAPVADAVVEALSADPRGVGTPGAAALEAEGSWPGAVGELACEELAGPVLAPFLKSDKARTALGLGLVAILGEQAAALASCSAGGEDADADAGADADADADSDADAIEGRVWAALQLLSVVVEGASAEVKGALLPALTARIAPHLPASGGGEDEMATTTTAATSTAASEFMTAGVSHITEQLQSVQVS